MMTGHTADRGNIYVGYHVVCIIDVLGQRNKLAEWAQMPAEGQAGPEFIQALKGSVGVVEFFRKAFTDFFAQISYDNFSVEQRHNLTPSKRDAFRKFLECDLHVQQFSDTFVFYAKLHNGFGEVSAEPFFRCLMACSMAMKLSLAAGVPVRGGMSLGVGLEIEPGNFYGPALAEAHQLESEVAEYPRVVLSNELQEFVAKATRFSDDALREKATQMLLQSCSKLIAKDTDGRFIVDFLGSGVRVVSATEEFVGLAAKAYRFVHEQVQHYERAGDRKLHARYMRLQSYMESRLSLWGLTIESALARHK